MPVLHFFTSTHTDYHRPEDDWDKIDAEGITRIADLSTRIAQRLAGSGTSVAMELTHVRQERQAPMSAQAQSGGRPYFGTIPDMTPRDFGMRITGVRDGSPAAEAGLQRLGKQRHQGLDRVFQLRDPPLAKAVAARLEGLRQLRLGYLPRFLFRCDQLFDLNGDGAVSIADHQMLITDFLKTSVGDSNLDGLFDSGDIVQIFQLGKYEDDIAKLEDKLREAKAAARLNHPNVIAIHGSVMAAQADPKLPQPA